MADKLEILKQKVTEVIARLDSLQGENTELVKENRELKRQISVLRAELDHLRLEQADQKMAVKSRLATMLNRVEELEKIGF